MPDPGKYENKSNFISDCIRTNINEGKKQDQAAAICYSMWERRNKKDKGKKMAAEILRELSMRIAFTFLGREPSDTEKKKLEEVFAKYSQEELKQLSFSADKWWFNFSNLMTKSPEQMREIVMSFYDKVLEPFITKHSEDKDLQDIKKMVTDVDTNKQRIHPAFVIKLIRDTIKEEATTLKEAADKRIYYGLFFKPPETNKLYHPSNSGPMLERKAPDPHITFAFKPTPEKTPPEDIIGKRFSVYIKGVGNDNNNHGYSVELPSDLKPYYVEDVPPHITLSLSNTAKGKDTANLDFKQISPFKVEGIFGYHNGARPITWKQ